MPEINKQNKNTKREISFFEIRIKIKINQKHVFGECMRPDIERILLVNVRGLTMDCKILQIFYFHFVK